MRNHRRKSFLPNLDRLERRDVPTVTASFVGTTLKLSGDNFGNSEFIGVSIAANVVWISGTGMQTQSIPASSISQIDIGGKGGDDSIWVIQRAAFPKPIRIFGDDGNDKITVDVSGNGIAHYSVDGGNGSNTVNVPTWMPVGPAGFPQSLAVYNARTSVSTLAFAQYSLRLNPSMGSINHQIIAPITNGPTNRSAANYQAVIEQFEVGPGSYARYAWDSYGTKCNVFAGDVMRAMQVPLPTKNDLGGMAGGGDITVGTVRLLTWLDTPSEGGSQGWHRIDLNSQSELDRFLSLVRQGYPALAISPPPPGQSSGHVAVVRPDQDLQRLTRDQLPNLVTAQAGASNFIRGHIADGWPASQYGSIQLYVNLGPVHYTIAWGHTDASSLSVDPTKEFFVNDVGLDLAGYAKARYGPSATVWLAAYNAYGWRVTYSSGGSTRTQGMDLLDATRWQGEQMYGAARLKNWGVYFTDFNTPYSWEGAFIFRTT